MMLRGLARLACLALLALRLHPAESYLTNVPARINEAFAALTASGAVVAWGNPDRGGNSTPVAASLASSVVSIASTGRAFAALTAGGRSWPGAIRPTAATQPLSPPASLQG